MLVTLSALINWTLSIKLYWVNEQLLNVYIIYCFVSFGKINVKFGCRVDISISLLNGLCEREKKYSV